MNDVVQVYFIWATVSCLRLLSVFSTSLTVFRVLNPHFSMADKPLTGTSLPKLELFFPFNFVVIYLYWWLKQRGFLSNWELELQNSSLSLRPLLQFQIQIPKHVPWRSTETTIIYSLQELELHCEFYFSLLKFSGEEKKHTHTYEAFINFELVHICCNLAVSSTATRIVWANSKWSFIWFTNKNHKWLYVKYYNLVLKIRLFLNFNLWYVP